MNKKWVVAGLIVGSLLIGEAVARFGLGLGDPPLSVVHPTIEYMYKPNQDVMRFVKNFIINHYGMRSENFPIEKSEKELRVMVFGDSVVNGGNLTDHADLATTLLENKLSVDNKKNSRVGNISAGSWGPGNWLAYAKDYGFFDADIIILIINSDDAHDNPTFEPLNPDTHPQNKPLLALWEGLTRYLPRYLPQFGKSPETPVVGQIDEVKGMVQGIADLKSFLRLARAQTSQVLVVQWPEQTELASGKFKTGYLEIKQIAEEMGVPVISMAPPVLKNMKDGGQPYRDNIHPNDLGQRIIAETLYRQLAGNEMLGR